MDDNDPTTWSPGEMADRLLRHAQKYNLDVQGVVTAAELMAMGHITLTSAGELIILSEELATEYAIYEMELQLHDD